MLSGQAAEAGSRRAEARSSASEQVCVRKKSVLSEKSKKCKALKLEDALWVRGITKRGYVIMWKSGHGRAESGSEMGNQKQFQAEE